MKALVTGVSRGIGRGICLRIARDALARGEEAWIAATATGRSSDLGETVGELEKLGARAIAIPGDLSDPETPARLVAETERFCGGLDALVCNAGFPLVGNLTDIKLRHWDLMFSLNVRSALLLGRAAHAALARSRGAICAIASTSATEPVAGLAGYAASKAALVMLAREMAVEWGPDGIRVNCVSPGSTRSRSTEAAFADPEALRERAESIPLRRVAEPEDIAAVVSFLVGPDAGYVTGQNIVMDGGRSLTRARTSGAMPWKNERRT